MPPRTTANASHLTSGGKHGYPRSMVRTSLSNLAAKVGSEIGVSEWFEVTQRVIDDFAGATQDLQWIHVDAERARASRHLERKTAQVAQSRMDF